MLMYYYHKILYIKVRYMNFAVLILYILFYTYILYYGLIHVYALLGFTALLCVQQ